MGTWAADSFGNDTAMDFVEEITNIDDVFRKLETVAKSAGYIEAPDAEETIAASELVAGYMGRRVPDFPNCDFLPKTKKTVADEHLANARIAIEKIRRNSELAELWAEDDDDSEWQAELDQLLDRLDPTKTYRKPRKATPEPPDDLLGYCLVCYGEVTERNGLEYKVRDGFAEMSITPCRTCVEKQCNGIAFNADGSPTAEGEKVMQRMMGLGD